MSTKPQQRIYPARTVLDPVTTTAPSEVVNLFFSCWKPLILAFDSSLRATGGAHTRLWLAWNLKAYKINVFSCFLWDMFWSLKVKWGKDRLWFIVKTIFHLKFMQIYHPYGDGGLLTLMQSGADRQQHLQQLNQFGRGIWTFLKN